MTKEKNDMTKEQQDLAWACLPKETRDKVISVYACKSGKHPYDEGYNDALRQLYGHHNLTSETEPEEMLMVARSNVIRKYKFADICDKDHPDKKYWDGAKYTLTKLFGDKCLPDKEPMKIDAADSLIAMAKDEMDITDELPKPKFSINDKVVFHPFKTESFYNAVVIEIKDGEDKPYLLKIEDAENIWAYPIEVEPYTEENQESMGEKNRCEKCGSNAQQCADSPCQNYPAKEDMEWKKPRMPKYIVQAQIRLISNHGMTIEDYECVEVEVSDIDLTQVAEVVHEALAKFHQQKQK